MITYHISQPDVSAEVFDQEVLAINLKTGHYHSFRDAGVPLWSLLTSGHSIESAAAALAAATGAPQETVRADAKAFAETLLSHGLLVEVETPETSTSLPLIPSGSYQAPTLEHYSDMQHLLLLDPIHEVDITGWPNQVTPPGSGS